MVWTALPYTTTSWRTSMDRRSKSHPHLSKTQTGMTNDWLSRPALISVRALWLRAHGYTAIPDVVGYYLPPFY
jgi:hypothetical protein